MTSTSTSSSSSASAAAAVHIPSQDALIDATIDRFALKVINGDAIDNNVDNDHNAAIIAESVGTALAIPPRALLQRVSCRLREIRADRAQLAKLLQDPGIEQRTPAWYAARGELITASDAAQALGCAKFGTQRQFFMKKCGYEREAFNPNVPPLKWGTMYEPVACEAYARRLNTQVHEFGLLRHPNIAHLGASPDGINSLGVMVEIKCPFRRKITGEVPMQYYYQMQGQLEVCSLTSCDYVECEIEEYSSWEELEAVLCDALERGQDLEDAGFVIERVYPAPSTDGSGLPTTVSKYAYSCEFVEMKPAGSDDDGMGALAADEVQHGDEDTGLAAATKRVQRLQRMWHAMMQDDNVAGPCDDAQRNGPHIAIRLRPYRILKMSVQRIKRDASFVSDMLTGLEEAWRQVIAYRADRALYDSQVVNGVAQAAASSTRSGSTATRKPRSTAANVLSGADNAVSLSGYSFIEDDA
jgi:putative phage-type endonuclease